MKKLPIGIQDFKKIREGDYLYVDKTQHLYQLTTEGSYYFLSRPRRFGKSLTVSTIAELFKGSQELFKGLWIEDKWDWNQTHPVIKIGFSSIGYKTVGLEAAIYTKLASEAESHGITLEQQGYDLQFQELIQKLYHKHGRVVILIDEYDKPIIDYLDHPEKAKAQRNILKTFYSVLKDADAYLKMLFLTGVSKFSKASIFSELNNLQELSSHPAYTTLLGYTQHELEHYFAAYINHFTPRFDSKEAFLQQIKHWYNGYTWDGINHVYNPFSILNFFDSGNFRNYWFESGTPTFLIKLLRNNQLYDMESIQTSYAAFGSYELDNISPETLMFQTGYITIKQDMGFGLYELGYPNQEVRESMLQYLLADYTQGGQGNAAAPALQMAHALVKDQLELLPNYINALLGSIPYDLHQNNEAYYHTIMHLAFSLIGVHIQSEIHVAKGRLDSIVQTNQAIYIFEFKVNSNAQEALSQIRTNNYAQAYQQKGLPIKAMGISFSTTTREVEDWAIEELTVS